MRAEKQRAFYMYSRCCVRLATVDDFLFLLCDKYVEVVVVVALVIVVVDVNAFRFGMGQGGMRRGRCKCAYAR